MISQCREDGGSGMSATTVNSEGVSESVFRVCFNVGVRGLLPDGRVDGREERIGIRHCGMDVGNIQRISVLHCPFICLGPTHYETSFRPGAVRGSILKRICGGCHRPGLLPGGREMLLRLSESRSHVRDLQDGVRSIEMMPGYDNVEPTRQRTSDGLPGPETHYHRTTHGRPA